MAGAQAIKHLLYNPTIGHLQIDCLQVHPPAMSIRIKNMQVEYLAGPAGKTLFVLTVLYTLTYLSYLVWPYMALPPQGAFYFWSTFKALLPLSIIYLSVLQITSLALTLIATAVGVAVIVGSVAQVVAFLVGALVSGSYSFTGNYLSFFIYTCVLLALEVVLTAFTLVVRAERRTHEQRALRDQENQIRQQTGYDVYIPGSGSANELRLSQAARRYGNGRSTYRYRATTPAGADVPLAALESTLAQGAGKSGLTGGGGVEIREDDVTGVAGRLGYVARQFEMHLNSRVPPIEHVGARGSSSRRRATAMRPQAGPGGYNQVPTSVDWSKLDL